MQAKHIIPIVFVSLLTAYVLFSLVFFPASHQPTFCTDISITIEDAKERAYVTPNELRTFLDAECGSPIGDTVNNALLASIEEHMKQHPLVRTAEAWCTPQGVIHLAVTQRQPMLHVMGTDNYYVDADRQKMPVRSSIAAYVPVVTGRVTPRLATGELFDFVEWMEDDPYWRAQIEQIHVVSPQRIELIPRVGSGVIVLGTLDNYPAKLRKLKKLYQDGFSNFGWDDYAEVDLRFRGQVVCRK